MSNDPEKVTLDDIVFENRNKEYGAYFLRKNYAKHLNSAVLIGVGVFTLIFGGAWTYQKYVFESPEVPDREVIFNPKPYPEAKKPVEALRKEVIKAAAPQIRFTEPEPVTDLTLTEDVIPSADVLEINVIAGTTIEGTGDAPPFAGPSTPVEVVKPAEPEKTEDNSILENVEKLPEFPGGMAEMYKFINSNIKYPSAAQRGNISGRVFVKFVVEKDGSISSIEIMKGIGFGCDEEAARVIKSMPRWSPAKQNGKSVRVYYNMPVFYRLE
jgi:protein TonB